MPEPDYLADTQPDHDLKAFAAILALEAQLRDTDQRAGAATLDIEQRNVYGRELTQSKSVSRRALVNFLDLGLSARCSHSGCSRPITRDTLTSAGAICDHGA